VFVVKPWVARVALVVGGALAGLLLLEVAVRVLAIPPVPLEPLPIPSYCLAADPAIVFQYRPGYRPGDRPFDPLHRGYTINASGFRDREYPVEKPPGTSRILMLGDSVTAGNGIPDPTLTFPKILEHLLNGDPADATRYEVLNMAVGGYHTMQEAATLERKGLRYDPDLVFVGFCMNDFDLHADGGVFERLKEANDGVPRSSHSTLYGALLKRSRLAFVLQHRLAAGRETEHDAWYATNVLHGKTPVRAGFELLEELQRAHGFALRVAIVPDFRFPFAAYRSAPVHAAVREAARDLPAVRVIDLGDAFAAVEADARKFSFDGCHLNAYGHRVMAELLLPIVRAALEDT
jgi:lysophospholipase L1-like esterase